MIGGFPAAWVLQAPFTMSISTLLHIDLGGTALNFTPAKEDPSVTLTVVTASKKGAADMEKISPKRDGHGP